MPSHDPDTGIEGAEGAAPLAWRTNLILFLATVASVFVTGVVSDPAATAAVKAVPEGGLGLRAIVAPFTAHAAVVHGSQFTAALLTILLAHEFGHYIAARIHKVDASLPFFIPMPLLSPFGTMGAVIRMRGTIPTRAALLDIGASGPLAGLAFALPMYFWGVAHSPLVSMANTSSEGMVELGDSLALRIMDHFAMAPVPEGMTPQLSPVAFAAWAGMFVTMINLLPVGQLDGGHVAFALFGTSQNRIAQAAHRAMLAFFFLLVGSALIHDIGVGFGLHRIGTHVGNAMFWLVWFQMLAILGSLANARHAPEPGALTVRTRLAAMLGLVVLASVGRERSSPILWVAWFLGLGMLLVMERRSGTLRPNALLDHPPTGAAPLGPGRTAVAILTLIFFVLLFMPRPISM